MQTQIGGEEIAHKAKEIYESQLRSVLEPEHVGKFLIIDVTSGDYEIDSSDIAASKRAHAKHPDGVFFGMRVGYRTSGTLGAWFQKRKTS